MISSPLNRLVRDFSKQGLWLSFALVGIVLQVTLTIYLPILIGRAVDAVVLPDNRSLILGIILKMLIIIVVNTLIQYLNPLIYNKLVFEFSRDLRQRVIEKVHQLPMAYLSQSVGDMVSRVTTDVEQLNNGLLMVFNQFFVGTLTILVTLITMAKIDTLMMMLVLCLTPLSLFLARFIARKSFVLFQKQTQARGRQTQMVEESLNQESLIQSFNAQEQFIERFFDLNEDYASYSQKAIFYSSIVNPVTRFVNALIYALLTAVGALRIMNGAFSIGQLTTFLNYVIQYTKPFNDVSSVLAELQGSLAAAQRLYQVLDQASLAETGQLELVSDQVQGQIDFEEVSFGYTPYKTLIKNLTIHIPPGSRVAIVGPTGAGKSTLINLLMRFYEVTAGHILLDHQPVTNYTRSSLRRQIGMVLQETWLQEATVHDNIAFGHPNATRELVVEAAKAANVDFFIRQLPQGYDTYLADAGASLSQGQRQLLTIARIFVAVPKILILDEATSSIDTRTESLIQDSLETLMQGRTSFIIAHRLSTIQKADIILVMVEGDIVEHGTHSELMAAQGFYYQMQIAQNQS
ncbi:ABC transporter ATP-binding protein [Streptococcus dentapri]|uniref:ABC transporter ATP-binding protein n=1 Tax=Streptococcus dentapri TaxID=573564 RepID=A0ABV8CZ31_9STRE